MLYFFQNCVVLSQKEVQNKVQHREKELTELKETEENLQV